MSSDLTGIPGIALCFVFWSDGDTGLSAILLFSCLAGIPGSALYFVFWSGGDTGSALYFVFWSGGDTGLSPVRCLLVQRGYRAQRCMLSSGLAGIPGSALSCVFWSGEDTGLSAVRCLLVWRGPGPALYFVNTETLSALVVTLGSSGRRIFFSALTFCADSYSVSVPPPFTTVARKRPRSFCRKVQVASNS